MKLASATEARKAIDKYGPEASAEWHRLDCFEAYYAGLHRPPYEPETATREFKELARRSVSNLLRLIVNTMTQRLVVDGFRPSETSVENAPQWSWWQANGLDARQKALYDEAAKLGYAGCLVMKPVEGPAPVMRPVSPREWWLGFEDYMDDWAFLALRKTDEDTWQILDDDVLWTVTTRGGDPVIEEEHGLGHVPIVPFRNQWNMSHYPDGEIAPAIAIQDRLNQTVFDLLVAQTYAAAPQKWASGLVMDTDANGRPIVDVRAFARSLWATSDPNARFGAIPEANLHNVVEAIEQCLRTYGLMTQTPPHYLLGDLVNLSAEALLAADTTLAKKVADRQVLFGESWEQTFRLAGVAANDKAAAADTEAQVWWRDTEPRSIAQQVDALGKLATMLQVPVTALWERVPGVTGSDLALWRTEAARVRFQAARSALTQTVSGGPNTGTPGANVEAAQGRAQAVG